MKLIIINGPCAIGKSTLSAKIHADMPLSFLLSIDAQRRFISHYAEQRDMSNIMIQAISSAILKSCLEINHDVIIDKMVFDQNILNSYYEIAKSHGATVHEIMLWAPKKFVINRAEKRGWRENGLLTPEKCGLFWDKINELKGGRPQAQIINVENMTTDEVYLKISMILK